MPEPTRFDDPFAYLEGAGADVASWQAQQDGEARAYLTGVAGLATLERSVARYVQACSDPPPVSAGAGWLRIAPHPASGEAAVWLADQPDAQGRVVVSAGELVVGPNAGIDWFAPSPDGAWVALGVSCRGDERSMLHFVDVGTGISAGGTIQHVAGGAVAWSPDSQGIYCLAGSPAEPHGQKDLLYAGPARSPRFLPAPIPYSRARNWLQLSPDGRHLGVGDAPSAPRLLAVLDVGDGVWRAVAGVADSQTFAGLFMDGHYYAVTTVDAPRGRLVRVPVERLTDAAAWLEVVPQRESVLRAVTRVADALVLCTFRDGSSELELITPLGHSLGKVPLESGGVVTTDPREPDQYGAAPPVHADRDGLTFSFTRVDRSPALMRYDIASRALRSYRRSAVVIGDIEVERLVASSSDGADVMYEFVSRRTRARPAPRPTLLTAYGGWNAMSASKAFLGELAPFVDAGGSVAFAHVRGDGTFGTDQWHGGRREHKQQTFDDVYAVAEDLASRGLTAPERLGLWGASNGGLLAGAAITQRPELFRAVVAVMPLLDMCRFVGDRFGEHCTWEYGDPRSPDAAAWLRRYSPYHNVEAGAGYPATLIVCGACDVRTPPWHGRKMLAALRRANNGDVPILLRVHDSHGHTSMSSAPPWMVAEWLGFLMNELGLTPAED